MPQAATDSKTALLDAGSELFLERGYNATGLKDILVSAGVPKGSFYHYFASKDEFGLEVVDRYNAATLAFIDELLADLSVSPFTRVRRFFEAAFSGFAGKDCRYGCLMGNLGQELGAVNDAFRVRIHEHLESWAARLAVGLGAAREAGELPSETDPHELGRLLIDGFQGAALRMKLAQGDAPLQRFMGHYFGTRFAA